MVVETEAPPCFSIFGNITPLHLGSLEKESFTKKNKSKSREGKVRSLLLAHGARNAEILILSLLQKLDYGQTIL